MANHCYDECRYAEYHYGECRGATMKNQFTPMRLNILLVSVELEK
jgi:hypothetical protein